MNLQNSGITSALLSLSLSLKHTHTHTQKHNSHFHNPVYSISFSFCHHCLIFEHKPKAKPHMFTAFEFLYILLIVFYATIFFGYIFSIIWNCWFLTTYLLLAFFIPVFSMVWQALDYLYPLLSLFALFLPSVAKLASFAFSWAHQTLSPLGLCSWITSSAWNVHFQYIWLTKLLVFFSSMLKSHPPSDIYLDTLFNSASVHIHQTPYFQSLCSCLLCFSLLRITFGTHVLFICSLSCPNHVPLTTEPMQNRMEATKGWYRDICLLCSFMDPKFLKQSLTIVT